MKISVITIVYNDRYNIEKTIKSVESQTERNNIEYIVVDGASNDGTSDIIKSLNTIDIYICEKDTGIYNAMNKGLQRATGDYVIFMNSGDCFSDCDVISKIIKAIENCDLTPALVYGDYRNIKNGDISPIIPSKKAQWIWYGPITSHQSIFYNLRYLNENCIRYDENYRIAADYKITLEVIKTSKYNVLKLPICISNFDISGISNKNQDLGLKEANKIRREILGWGSIKEKSLTIILLLARFGRVHFSKLHNYLRRL